MSEDIDMVFSNCVEWLRDWVEANPPNLKDEWDLSQWMENEMTEATNAFLEYGFKTARARNDAIMILRSLYYEYYLFQREIALHALAPNPAAVLRLPNLPQSNQKSGAWHAEGRELLSGHEFGPICVGTPSEWTAVLAKKCVPETTIAPSDAVQESRTVYLTPEDGSLSAFKWGWRYEPVARDVFELIVAEGKVNDTLGRIRHPTLPGLGASPDGLIMDGPRSGRLVEIKCPITREITGEIPIRYYCQMQLQAEVCDVEAVEYFEIQFGAVPQAVAEEAAKAKNTKDTVINKGKKTWIGKVCVIAKTADAAPETYEYAYSKVFPATERGLKDCLKWSAPMITLESSIWYVKDSFHSTVIRNREWWSAVGFPSYKRFWEDVTKARAEGRFKTKPLFVDTDSEGPVMEADDVPVAEEEDAAVPVAEEAEEPVSKVPLFISSDEEDAEGAENEEEVSESDRVSDGTESDVDAHTNGIVVTIAATDVET